MDSTVATHGSVSPPIAKSIPGSVSTIELHGKTYIMEIMVTGASDHLISALNSDADTRAALLIQIKKAKTAAEEILKNSQNFTCDEQTLEDDMQLPSLESIELKNGKNISLTKQRTTNQYTITEDVDTETDSLDSSLNAISAIFERVHTRRDSAARTIGDAWNTFKEAREATISRPPTPISSPTSRDGARSRSLSEDGSRGGPLAEDGSRGGPLAEDGSRSRSPSEDGIDDSLSRSLPRDFDRNGDRARSPHTGSLVENPTFNGLRTLHERPVPGLESLLMPVDGRPLTTSVRLVPQQPIRMPSKLRTGSLTQPLVRTSRLEARSTHQGVEERSRQRDEERRPLQRVVEPVRASISEEVDSNAATTALLDRTAFGFFARSNAEECIDHIAALAKTPLSNREWKVISEAIDRQGVTIDARLEETMKTIKSLEPTSTTTDIIKKISSYHIYAVKLISAIQKHDAVDVATQLRAKFVSERGLSPISIASSQHSDVTEALYT